MFGAVLQNVLKSKLRSPKSTAVPNSKTQTQIPIKLNLTKSTDTPNLKTNKTKSPKKLDLTTVPQSSSSWGTRAHVPS